METSELDSCTECVYKLKEVGSTKTVPINEDQFFMCYACEVQCLSNAIKIEK